MELRPQLISAVLLLLLVFSFPGRAVAQTAEDRAFVERIFKKKLSNEDAMLNLVFISDFEGNLVTLRKLEDLQTYYATHKPKNIFRQAWCAAKSAHYELLKGRVEQSSKQCARALQFLKSTPDPLYGDSCFFYKDALKTLYPELYKLNRREEGDRLRQELAVAHRNFGKEDSRHKLFDALDHLMNGDFEQAKAACAEGMRLDPGYCGNYYVRGLIRFEERHAEKAILDLNYALQLCPKFPSALILLGRCELIQKSYAQAIARLDQAAVLGMCTDEVLALRGLARSYTGDLTGALDDMGKALNREQIERWLVDDSRVDI